MPAVTVHVSFGRRKDMESWANGVSYAYTRALLGEEYEWSGTTNEEYTRLYRVPVTERLYDGADSVTTFTVRTIGGTGNRESVPEATNR